MGILNTLAETFKSSVSIYSTALISGIVATPIAAGSLTDNSTAHNEVDKGYESYVKAEDKKLQPEFTPK